MRYLLAGALMVLATTATTHAAGRPMTVDDLLMVKGVSDPQVSPDGSRVVYVVSEIDRETRKSSSDLWLVPLKEGTPRRLTTAPGTDNHPRWSPDGKTIAFVSDRSGSQQVWLLPIGDGGEPRLLTKLPIDMNGPLWSPRGDKIAFTAEVYPGTTPEETARRDEEKAKSPSKARVFDALLIRHWNTWTEGKRSHLFTCEIANGHTIDLTPKLDVNTPPGPFGGSEEYAWSPEGRELAFTAEPSKDRAWSTNSDIWVIPSWGGEPRNVTAANPGADGQPTFLPGPGRMLAYVSQSRAGFEADLWVVKTLDLDDPSKPMPRTTAWDRPVMSFCVTDSRPVNLYAVIDDAGTEAIASMTIKTDSDASPSDIHRIVTGGVNTSVDVTTNDNLVFLRGDSTKPAELYTSKTDGSDLRPLSHHNDALVAQLDVNRAEGFTFPGHGGDPVQGWIVKPPKFDPSKSYPVLFLIHGGPQGAWHDEWHNRWNYPLFAAPGYVVVAINPRGSTGYGQSFTDQISTDWNGKVFDDLMLGLDHALKTYPFLDKNRMAAAGGSFGGYMVNWIAGHTDRFKALISHAGIFDLTSMNSTTEELWFAEWEFGGMSWDAPERYLAQSPSTYVKNFRTPTLVIHGALDFRVPDAQGLGMFTALQRRGVASRYLWFPDEGHWITKPANRVLWWNEMHRWLAQYLKP